jgi:Uma2 family endonuclease
MAVREYLGRHPVGLAFGSRSDLSWGKDDVLVSPDLFVVPLDEARRLDWLALRTVLVAAEVLSPSTKRADRFTKRRLYQEHEVPLYWVIDPDEHVAEVWLPGDQFPRFERARLEWSPAGADESFSLALADLLRPI